MPNLVRICVLHADIFLPYFCHNARALTQAWAGFEAQGHQARSMMWHTFLLLSPPSITLLLWLPGCLDCRCCWQSSSYWCCVPICMFVLRTSTGYVGLPDRSQVQRVCSELSGMLFSAWVTVCASQHEAVLAGSASNGCASHFFAWSWGCGCKLAQQHARRPQAPQLQVS